MTLREKLKDCSDLRFRKTIFQLLKRQPKGKATQNCKYIEMFWNSDVSFLLYRLTFLFGYHSSTQLIMRGRADLVSSARALPTHMSRDTKSVLCDLQETHKSDKYLLPQNL
jgi:hypothetical protein